MNEQSKHSAAAELHFYAAYEHWVAEYWEQHGNRASARRSAKRALQHSVKAAALSREALGTESVNAIRATGQEPSVSTPFNRSVAFRRICNAIADQNANAAVA